MLMSPYIVGDEADKSFEKVAKRFKKKEEEAKAKSVRPKRPLGNFRGGYASASQGYAPPGYAPQGYSQYWAQRVAMPPPPPPPLPQGPPPGPRLPKAQLRCNSCGEFGHFVRECTKVAMK